MQYGRSSTDPPPVDPPDRGVPLSQTNRRFADQKYELCLLLFSYSDKLSVVTL
jgi:hypothetical protein